MISEFPISIIIKNSYIIIKAGWNGYIKETMPALWAPSGTEQGKAVGQATAKATSNIEQDRPDIFRNCKDQGARQVRNSWLK